MKKLAKKIILIIAALVVGIVLVEMCGILPGREVALYVPAGMYPAEIYSMLENEGVINSKILFSAYSRGAASKFTSGYHTLEKNMSYGKIVSELTSPGKMSDLQMVTFPEGYELREFALLLEEKDIKNADDFIKASNKKYDYEFLPPRKDGYLEGYLFPDTYSISPEMTCEDIIKMMLTRFDEIYTDEFEKRAKELDMTTSEVVTLASIIEREAAVKNERALVSSVFHNRLKSDEYPYLQSCATVQYLLKERKDILSNADIAIDSPYNTYKYPGLPPGPIASPGKACIEAALYPADTDYYFFVANGDGTQTFSETFREHMSSGVNR